MSLLKHKCFTVIFDQFNVSLLNKIIIIIKSYWSQT